MRKVGANSNAISTATGEGEKGVRRHLAKQDQPAWRRRLHAEHGHRTYAEDKRTLERLSREDRVVNESGTASLAEAQEDTLTLPRLRVFSALWAIERQFRRVRYYRQLPLLRRALERTLSPITTAWA